MSASALRVLVIDDEPPALDELMFLLRRDDRVGDVHGTDSPTEALRLLQQRDVDAVFLDVQMPGLSGIELAEVLTRFRTPPALVFVTAHDEHAVAAFDLDAVDYVLKPIREDRLAEAVRRVLHQRGGDVGGSDQVAVERAGVTRFLTRGQIRYVEAEGDYARLHTADDSFLLRAPLTQLEHEWAAAGFVRAHRSLLISTGYVEELYTDSGRTWVVVDGHRLAVSRRHARDLRERLLGRARGSTGEAEP